MFCIQCEQTIRAAHSVGCAYGQGMCGKTAEVSDLQDVLITCLQGLSYWRVLAREYQIVDSQIDRWSAKAFFSTLTNVNFDPQRIMQYINITESYKQQLLSAVSEAATKAQQQLPPLSYAARLQIPTIKEDMAHVTTHTMVNRGKEHLGEDIIGLRLLCLYGLKGAAAYMEHAAVLGQTDHEVYDQYHKIMSYLGDNPNSIEDLFATAMQIGHLNYIIMEMLDRGETETFGHPIPSQVNVSPIQGKCILVSGHDLEDLYLILEQTKDLGINVYTHGEMLPAHSYPELKKYPHLVGNYGSAWQNQQKEFAQFPGAIVMTSNCIINPNVGQYIDRIFTRNIVAWPGAEHIEGDDFSAVIKKALSLTGFTQTEPEHLITIGFGRNALMNAAPAVISQIKAGNISHFFLVGGCDGDRAERNYYADFVSKVPQDSMILTLACGKYRFNKNEYGDINGIPRLLDIGQCNDTYSAIQLALTLSKEFDCHINDLPLTLVLSWFEQKAIVVLLTLLSLGVKGIYIGPTLPAFLTENLIASLQEQFDLRLINDPKQDLDTMLKEKAA